MLNLKYPVFLWLGFTILPVLFFYFLRMRFRRHPVSSLYIWSKLQSEIQGGNKLRRRSIFLLVFQLLAVTAAVMAGSQPFWNSEIHSQPSILYLVDRSASMTSMDLFDSNLKTKPDLKGKTAVESQPRSRLDAAKEYLTREIRKLSPGTVVMVIGCASGIDPLGNPTTRRQNVINQLKQLKPSYAAFAEAKVADDLQSWLAIHKRAWRVVLITDGGLDLGGERLAVGLEGMLQTKIIGQNGNNLGVTALRVDTETVNQTTAVLKSDGSRTLVSKGKAQFLIYNGWPEERLAKVILYGDGEQGPLGHLNLKVPPGNTYQTLEFTYSKQSSFYTIQLDQKPDQLAADDSFSLAVNPSRKVKVLIVGPENPFLKAALQHPQIELSQIADFPSVFTGDGWDLVIADQKKVPDGLRCNLLTFKTAPRSGSVKFGASVAGPFDQAGFNHPLLRYIDWRLVQTSDGYALKTKPEARVLATVGNQPILAVWEEPEGWRRIVFGVDLFHSNLGISGAFPVFVANLLQWIVPQFNNPLAYTLNVGEPVTLAEPQDWRVLNTRLIDEKGDAKIFQVGETHRMEGTGKRDWKVVDAWLITEVRQGGGKGPLVTLTGLTPGIFQWGRGRERGIIAVNTAPLDMDITPQPLQIQQTASHTTVGDFNAATPLGAWLLAFLLLALLAEWILWRGIPLLK